MATDLNVITQKSIVYPQAQELAQHRVQDKETANNFASVMSKMGENSQAVQALSTSGSSFMQSGTGARSSTERHFEQILGDSLGIANARALAQISSFMSTNGNSTMDVARNVLGTRNIMATLSGQVVHSESGLGSNIVRRAIISPKDSELLGGRKASAEEEAIAKAPNEPRSSGLTVTGALSARFESGQDGIAAIGYDRHGGTSYGKYQISSKAGSMDQFINFLNKEAPAFAKQLEEAGASNTGSCRGKMPEEWKKIAQENPDFFRDLQERFIHNSHYKPALAALSQRTDITNDKMSAALQEVLWSTAVQHGPNGAARIFSRAMGKMDPELADKAGTPEFEKAMIENVYAMRSTQFGSSTEQVQHAVQNRLKEEKSLALNMLNHLSDNFA